MSDDKDKPHTLLHPGRLNGGLTQQVRHRFARVGDILLFALLIGLLTLIYSPVALMPPYQPLVGEIVRHDIKAQQEILVEDGDSTRKRRAEAAALVLPVYDWDGGMFTAEGNRLREGLLWLDKAKHPSDATPAPELQPDNQVETPPAPILDKKELHARFLRQIEEQEMPAGLFNALLARDDLASLAGAVNVWLDAAGKRPIVGTAEQLKELRKSPFVVRDIFDGTETRHASAEQVVTVDGLREPLSQSAAILLEGSSREFRRWLVDVAMGQVRPNLVLNLAETRERQRKAFEAVDTAYFQVRRGEMLVREGEVVTEAAFLKIQAMNESLRTGIAIYRLLGLAACLVLFFWLSRRFLLTTSTSFPRDKKTLYIMGTIVFVVGLMDIVVLAVGQGLAELFHWPVSMVAYLPPVALGSALTSLIIGSRATIPGGSMVVGTLLAFLTALVDNAGLPAFIFYFIGSLVGSFSLRTCRHRFHVLRAGAWIALFQALTVPVVESLAGNFPTWQWGIGMGMAAASGLLAGLLGLALIPMLEYMFNIVTDSRLVELASGDHPLLKQLSLRAPGTYHHSVMMGNLAEAAAEAIGANPLMARVMALYHDIGKMTKPHYFVENQGSENRHDHLSPSMSTKVIISHVKDGVELAREYKLAGPILEAIVEHHGTGLLQYFYNKAVNEAVKRGEMVSEDEFRYPGPKPQSRESGILMVADSVEAAARTLKSPTPAQIQSLVRRIVTSKMGDGQLDDCRLTLRELSQIEDAFTRVLTLGFYHHRIEYPELQRRQGVRSGGNPGQSQLRRLARG